MARRREFSTAQWVEGVLSGDRAILARAITLIESHKAEHRDEAQRVLAALQPHSGGSRRIGLSGVPGVGKSTFIEAIGTRLCAAGHKTAVLAIDPSSQRHGGSILGDKTRMAILSVHPNAFIRPSPTNGTLGGVAGMTRETILLVEAAGYDTVLVETVGVGQSETMVAAMTDFYLLLMLPGTGDDLQGIKKGVLELADMVVVNKADGDTVIRAKQAARDYQNALHMLSPTDPEWVVPVQTCSAVEGHGLEELWSTVERYFDQSGAAERIAEKRQKQQLQWMWTMVQSGLKDMLKDSAGPLIAETESAVLKQTLSAKSAARQLLSTLKKSPPPP